VRESLEELHRGIRECRCIENLVYRIWDHQENPGEGAWVAYGPGDWSRYREDLRAPIQDADGRDKVFFAGEHLEMPHGWMQPAVQTGIAAAYHILKS